MKVDAELQKKVMRAGEIFDRYGNLIRAMIYANISDRSKAEDIFQNLFLEMVRRPVPPDVRYIKGYLCRVVTNDVLDNVRQSKSYHTKIRKYARIQNRSTSHLAPENIISQAEEREKFFRQIEWYLPPRQARAIVQRFKHGNNPDLAAEAMGVSKKTFTRYLCVALQELRKLAEEGENDSGPMIIKP